MSTFLDQNEISTLTGRKMKTHQINALRTMGIPFFVNAIGRAVVTRSAIELTKNIQISHTPWKSNALTTRR